MDPRAERLLGEFVDRTEEMSIFSNFLEPGASTAIQLKAPGGSGKSSLLTKMQCQCREMGIPSVTILWTGNRSYNYLDVMRQIRDALDQQGFEEFNDLVNHYTEPGYTLKLSVDSNVSVADGATISGTTGDVSGVVIRDSKFLLPPSSREEQERERKVRLTDCFLRCISSLLRDCRMVVFFDAAEKMPSDTQAWIWEELLPAVDVGLLGLRVVVSGRQHPEIEADLARRIEFISLKPLEEEHIIEYFRKRGLDEPSEDLAFVALQGTKGHPLDLAILVDAFLKRKRSRPDG